MDAEKLLDRQIATYLLIGKTDHDIHEVEVSVALLKETMDGIEKRHTHDKVCMYCRRVYGSFVAYNLEPGLVSHGVCPDCVPRAEKQMKIFMERRNEWEPKTKNQGI